MEGGEVYLDSVNAFKQSLGNRRVGYASLLAPSMWQSASRAKAKYPDMPSDLKGDGFGLGGLILIKKGDPGEVVYVHEEKVIGDIADMQEVADALRLHLELE